LRFADIKIGSHAREKISMSAQRWNIGDRRKLKPSIAVIHHTAIERRALRPPGYGLLAAHARMTLGWIYQARGSSRHGNRVWHLSPSGPVILSQPSAACRLSLANDRLTP
jgi:hypothetical protein